MVAQVGSSNTTFRTTKKYEYNAGTLTEMPPEKMRRKTDRQAFSKTKRKKEEKGKMTYSEAVDYILDIPKFTKKMMRSIRKLF